MMQDVVKLIGLALVDAMNPFSIAAMALMLVTDRPVQRGVTFIVGTFLIYLIFGFVLVQGWSAILTSMLPSLSSWLPAVLYAAGGLVCLAVAFYLYSQGRNESNASVRVPTNLSLGATFIFAIGSTVSDLPTAVPYFAGASIIENVGTSFIAMLGLLLAYNFIYVSPLLLMLVIRMSTGEHAEPYLQKIRQLVDWAFSKLVPPFIGVFGIYLLTMSLI